MNNDIFVEQAEYLNPESLLLWNEEHPNEEIIIKKLSQNGAKLLTGPRGSGKTTLMLKTYHSLCKSNSKKAIPIYINFKASLKIEPLYKSNTSAVYWFNQWIMFKVYEGLYKTIYDLKINKDIDLLFSEKEVKDVISKLEFGKITTVGNIELSLNTIEEEIEKLLSVINKTHCVLLLDDAAHAFSAEQQRDFFEFFRKIKSRIVSPKAAVYPGVTVYSSTFHVGHDAEEIDVWLKPDSEQYLLFMVGLLEKRLPKEVFDTLNKNKDLLEVVCYSAFGLPRALLNIVRHFYSDRNENDENEESYEIIFNRVTVNRIISNVFKQSLNIYSTLRYKLPTYNKFIEKGIVLYDEMVDLIKDYNKNKNPSNQTVNIAINKPIPLELSKIIGFFQYGGLIMPKGEISKGEKGVFELYTIHYAALIERNAFLGRKSISLPNLLTSLKVRNLHEYKRIKPYTLIGTEDMANAFPLSLPPCQVCGTPRISEHSKFCDYCGAKLKSISIFESLVDNDINVLPLTQKRVKGIKEHSNIKTIKDILMDTENRELRSVPQIGPYWADRIFSYAEEYIV